MKDGVSSAIVRKIAEKEGVDPTEMTPSLYEAIDPDALNRLFQGYNSELQTGHVEFFYHGYRVVVHNNGTVSISNPDESTDGGRIMESDPHSDPDANQTLAEEKE